jgi:hypothetical protein
MTIEVDSSAWSGEGTFTQLLVDRLRGLDEIAFVRVEDAPASRSEADYNFISNEIYVTFALAQRTERARLLGIFPIVRRVPEKAMSIAGLERELAQRREIGPPDYSDDSMIQYLRTERIVPPYQTRGFKLVELVRIYEVGADARR